MREKLTNAGKKEQRQFNQVLNKIVKQEREPVRELESRTTPKQHRLKGKKGK